MSISTATIFLDSFLNCLIVTKNIYFPKQSKDSRLPYVGISIVNHFLDKEV